MPSIVVTPEVSHAPMSSLKDVESPHDPTNKYDMSVTPPVAHVEMWPCGAPRRPRPRTTQRRRSRRLVSSMIIVPCVGAGVAVGATVIVGAGEGVIEAKARSSVVAARTSRSHGVPIARRRTSILLAKSRFTPSSTHQPRS